VRALGAPRPPPTSGGGSRRPGDADDREAAISPEPARGGPFRSIRLRVYQLPSTRAHAGLLGPCFKTGRVGRPLVNVADKRRRPRQSGSRAGNARRTAAGKPASGDGEPFARVDDA
jgi:hypothetical protein